MYTLSDKDIVRQGLSEQGITVLPDDPEQVRLVEDLIRGGNKSGFTLTKAQQALQSQKNLTPEKFLEFRNQFLKSQGVIDEQESSKKDLKEVVSLMELAFEKQILAILSEVSSAMQKAKEAEDKATEAKKKVPNWGSGEPSPTSSSSSSSSSSTVKTPEHQKAEALAFEAIFEAEKLNAEAQRIKILSEIVLDDFSRLGDKLNRKYHMIVLHAKKINQLKETLVTQAKTNGAWMVSRNELPLNSPFLRESTRRPGGLSLILSHKPFDIAVPVPVSITPAGYQVMVQRNGIEKTETLKNFSELMDFAKREQEYRTLLAAQIASQKPQIVAQEQKILNEKPQGTQAQQPQSEEDPKRMRKQKFLQEATLYWQENKGALPPPEGFIFKDLTPAKLDQVRLLVSLPNPNGTTQYQEPFKLHIHENGYTIETGIGSEMIHANNFEDLLKEISAFRDRRVVALEHEITKKQTIPLAPPSVAQKTTVAFQEPESPQAQQLEQPEALELPTQEPTIHALVSQAEMPKNSDMPQNSQSQEDTKPKNPSTNVTSARATTHATTHAKQAGALSDLATPATDTTKVEFVVKQVKDKGIQKKLEGGGGKKQVVFRDEAPTQFGRPLETYEPKPPASGNKLVELLMAPIDYIAETPPGRYIAQKSRNFIELLTKPKEKENAQAKNAQAKTENDDITTTQMLSTKGGRKPSNIGGSTPSPLEPPPPNPPLTLGEIRVEPLHQIAKGSAGTENENRPTNPPQVPPKPKN